MDRNRVDEPCTHLMIPGELLIGPGHPAHSAKRAPHVERLTDPGHNLTVGQETTNREKSGKSLCQEKHRFTRLQYEAPDHLEDGPYPIIDQVSCAYLDQGIESQSKIDQQCEDAVDEDEHRRDPVDAPGVQHVWATRHEPGGIQQKDTGHEDRVQYGRRRLRLSTHPSPVQQGQSAPSNALPITTPSTPKFMYISAKKPGGEPVSGPAP